MTENLHPPRMMSELLLDFLSCHIGVVIDQEPWHDLATSGAYHDVIQYDAGIVKHVLDNADEVDRTSAE